MADRQRFKYIPGGPEERVSGLGQWSLASAADQAVAGLVEWEVSEGWSLTLQGRLFDRHATNIGPVLGVTSAGEKITLVNVYPRGETTFGIGSAKRVEQKCRATGGFVGAHLPSVDDRSFTWGSFSFPHLNAWLNESLESLANEDDSQTGWRRNDVDKRETTWQGSRIVLDSGFVSYDDQDSMSLRRRTWFEAEASEKMPTERWIGTFVEPVNALMSIATLVPNDIDELTFLIRHGELDGRTPLPTSIRCLHQVTRKPEAHRPLFAHDLLFSIQELPAPFESFAPSWLALYERYRQVFTLSMAARFEGVGYLDNQFLNTVTAAEIYHRLKYPDQIDDPKQHANRLDRVVGAVAESDKAWLRSQLEHSNRPRLAQRLTVLFESAQPQVGFKGDPPTIAKRIANTRNHLTHRSKETRSRAAGPHGQVNLMWTVWFVLLAELLKEVGFDGVFVSERLGRDWRCRAIRERNLLADDDDEE